MWRIRSSSWRRPLFVAATGTAVALVELWNQDDEVKLVRNNKSAKAVASSETSFRQFKIEPPLYISSCQCEKVQPTPTQKAAIQRRATIHALNATSTPLRNLNAIYKINWKNHLGEGAFGSVYLATNRETGEKVALKKIPKKFTNSASFQNEMNALLQIRTNGGHPNICSLRENFEDHLHYYVVLDLVSGGEMFDHLIKMGAYSEADAARLVREVANALTFMHGIGITHGDLKPENLMLSTNRKEDSTIQIVDFGCSQVSSPKGIIETKSSAGNTPAYCPPEVLENPNDPVSSKMDIWGLGVVIYIMLTGLHPFDLNGKNTDEDIERALKLKQSPPMRNSPITAHLSPSALDVIEKCIVWDPDKRISGLELLAHPWVTGETASADKMTDASKKLSMFRVFKSKLEAKVFESFCSWSDRDDGNAMKKSALVERAFHSLDLNDKGFLTREDLRLLTKRKSNLTSQSAEEEGEDGNKPLSLSGFSELLGENMKNVYFPGGHTIYEEGDVGNHMYFINSGIIEVTTRDGAKNRRSQNDFFGEGALLHPKKIRSASIKCVTPVNAISISREYFDKYLASSGLTQDLKEKDKTRKRNRAKTILRLQKNLKPISVKNGDALFRCGEEAESLFILENGKVDILVGGKKVFNLSAGDIFGEHSLIMSRPRNTSAVCRSNNCLVYEMKERDFYEIYTSSTQVRTSLRELCFRREFQKALVKKTGKEFPSIRDLREVFDAADPDKTGLLEIDQVAVVLKSFDPSLTESEIQEVLNALDDSGKISFHEFKLIFGMNKSRAASI